MDNNPSNAVEYTSTELPENCNKFLANLWDNKVDKFQDLQWEKILQTEENNLLSEMETEYFSKR